MDETQLPDDLLKYIDETIDEYTGKLKKLEENCDIAVKATLSEVKQSHLELQENHDRVHETRERLEREIQSTKESIATYEQKIAQTKDGSSLARQVNLQKEELERDRQRNEILQKKRDELLLLLQQKRNDIHNKQMSAIRRKQSVKIDLETCKKVTQLEISPTGVEDEIRFVFRCIRKNLREEPYSFQLFIDEKQCYSVSHCSPPLQEMELLLNQLNNDREIYTFVKRVRKAFVDQAAN